jgi:uncharacterized protein (DUF305 family)
MNMYIKLGIMSFISFWIMYVLMYAMVDKFADAFFSQARVYMALAMTAPMLILAILIMGSMYKNKTANIAIVAAGALLLFLSVYAMRDQTAIYETQFLRSMIPHHSSAILMCENPRLENAEIRKLCDEIIKTQEEEIAIMNRMLAQGVGD